MNNIKKNKEKEEERKRLAKALKQNILKRKKQQQSRQSRPLSKLVCGEEFLGGSSAEYPNVFEEALTTKLPPELKFWRRSYARTTGSGSNI